MVFVFTSTIFFAFALKKKKKKIAGFGEYSLLPLGGTSPHFNAKVGRARCKDVVYGVEIDVIHAVRMTRELLQDFVLPVASTYIKEVYIWVHRP